MIPGRHHSPSRGRPWSCSIRGRVPLADALTRAAWRFYTAGGQWSANPDDATTVFVGEGQRVMFYNTYLRRYRTIYVTYYRPKAGFSGEVRLTKVVFN